MKVFINAIIIFIFLNISLYTCQIAAQSVASKKDAISANDEKTMELNDSPLIVKRCGDFILTGKGDEIEWKKTKWNVLTKLDSGGNNYKSRFKILYSQNGIYVLFNGEDEKIATQENQDFGAIYNGDAFEVFFHPVTAIPKYFEYEINQLNKVLILMISRVSDKSYDWIPWHYTNGKQMVTMVNVISGKMEAGDTIKSWSAEIFFPFGILNLLGNVPPGSGAVWNANFCRLDYDSGQMIKWSWSPKIKTSFHELENFLSIKFE